MEHETGGGPPPWHHIYVAHRKLRRALSDMIARHVPSSAGRSCFDFGCGTRRYEGLVKHAGLRYVAGDIQGSAEQREGISVDIPFVPGTPVEADDGAFDLVLSTQVLEHVWDVGWYLGEARRMLAPEGVLLLSTHGHWPYHPHPTDFRRWTKDGLDRELRSAGLVPRETVPLLGPLTWTLMFQTFCVREVLVRGGALGRAASHAACLASNLLQEGFDAITPRNVLSDHAAIYVVACGLV